MAFQSFCVVNKRIGHVLIKLTLRRLIGYLGTLCLIAAKAISACAWIYAAYAPGFVIYATKFPKNKKWGYHSGHISVLMGNLDSRWASTSAFLVCSSCVRGVACVAGVAADVRAAALAACLSAGGVRRGWACFPHAIAATPSGLLRQDRYV